MIPPYQKILRNFQSLTDFYFIGEGMTATSA